ncbi:C1 family peptidase [Amnibacterium sp.]|uniref:C1 family peptidase n=1 Tax=Amnibacterium sp. TaxID=1872496 RepID=UPI0026027C9F|nr:C1 family peptidase [Amnibacterium sp.]MCU1474250.1 cysteine protease [Amnibacterium sp.]
MLVSTRLTLGAAGALVAGLLVSAALPASAVPAATSDSTSTPVGGYARSGSPVAPNVGGLVPASVGRMHALATATLPASVNLEKWAVAPGDQKQVGSCVAWTIGYSMLGYYSVYRGSSRTFAPMYLYSQDHLPNDGGSTSLDAYAILMKQGIAPSTSYREGDYNWTHKPTAAEKAAAVAYTATAPHYLYNVFGSGPGTAARTAIETALSKKHPVALGIPVFPAFERLTASHSVLRASSIPAGARSLGGHMVLVVGYDSTGVIIENQWGTSWGAGGFAKLDWSFVERYSMEASWIYGFASSVPATPPAQVDGFTTTVENTGTDSADLSVSWDRTGSYEDMLRHPVTGYVATLTGSDGSARTAPSTGASQSSADFTGLGYDTTYTLSVRASNAVGAGAPQVFTFTPSRYGDSGSFLGDPITGSPLPTPAMAPANATPATNPGAPATAWPTLSWTHLGISWTKPPFTGHRAITAYRVRIVGQRSGTTVYSHTWTLSSARRSLTAAFRTAAHHASTTVPKKLPTYIISVQSRNTGGRWSSVSGTTIRLHWTSSGFSGTASRS